MFRRATEAIAEIWSKRIADAANEEMAIFSVERVRMKRRVYHGVVRLTFTIGLAFPLGETIPEGSGQIHIRPRPTIA